MTDDHNDLVAFVRTRLDEDEQRHAQQLLPYLDEAERRGRIRIMRTDDGQGLHLAAGPLAAREERVPVPFPEKVTYLRREISDGGDPDTLKLIASVYAGHADWRPEWEL
ncbi:DUF6221 family protein [Prauserella rugosa]|uniref:Uncharacterized protein n=1 Tax=Prauserella rugosa TaxID=43354 RepID=A0A660C609_9PSEU|nr:DUF6221 family protein [Prauserella rugosa]KID29944.1 hypothetical protein HQ32_02823 [Prauserella sp. Am3]KMS84397.1 hypothetical protein ACZ91_48045 [Streptomyces regensis]TWH18776.1 hypothetical protein JD82_00597 [Prauserella rugosa]